MKLDEVFKKRKGILIPYITCGDPSLSWTERLIASIESAGADIVELGVPFSDPIADGPIIQSAYNRALRKGVTLAKVIQLVKRVKRSISIPVILLSYYNLIYKYGVKRFVEEAKESGVEGVVVPDLPPEEAEELTSSAKRADFSVIFLLAPTSTNERVNLISSVSEGFVYYVSLTGVTGVRESLVSHLRANLTRIKKLCKKPVAVGFGISNPAQAKKVARMADGVIVGSAIVDIIAKNQKDPERPIFDFVSSLKSAVKKI
jgi:tryptophan synthase alpha chain